MAFNNFFGMATITSSVIEGITFGLYTRNKPGKMDDLALKVEANIASAADELGVFSKILETKEYFDLQTVLNKLNEDYNKHVGVPEAGNVEDCSQTHGISHTEGISRSTFIKKKEYEKKKKTLRDLNAQAAALRRRAKIVSSDAIWKEAERQRKVREENNERIARANRIQDLTDKLRLKSILINNNLRPIAPDLELTEV
ncbi:hypothetical protein DXG01_010781 [Tephrocybe rancida]|nr:hypothetical protein DXG01_010781 [Tephrocybe rancida]